ncbi:MAG: AmmeMemoRadiSam system protein B [Alphaproteobacteria bacterium]|nr:AmmeMemoRadiSam system protein B [Alphaproteobacteria bacterium]
MKRKLKFEPIKISRYVLWGIVIIVFLILNYWYLDKYLSFNSAYVTDYQEPEDLLSQYRKPAVAGIFYEGEDKIPSKEEDNYLKSGKFRDHQDYKSKIIIVPYAGYNYSTATAAKAYLPLKNYKKIIKNVLLLGPLNHNKGIFLSDADYFKTPLGSIAVNKKTVYQLAEKNKNFSIDKRVFVKENSLKNHLPFIQKILPQAKIIPMMYGETSAETVAQALKEYLERKDTILIISADLSLYRSYDTARGAIQKNDEQMQKEKNEDDYCGAIGIKSALILAEQLNYYPQMIELINSEQATDGKNNVVGYGIWDFYSPSKTEENANRLDREVQNIKNYVNLYGHNLKEIADISLEKAVRHHKKYSPSRRSYPEKIFDRGASYITLYQNGNLRGSAGSVLPSASIAQNIADNMYFAALEDKRFSSVKLKELQEINYTISLLTGFEEIIYHNEKEVIGKIQENKDGIVIRDGNRQGVFLPEVWKQFPEKNDFFKQLKIKAGIHPNYWRNNIKVYRFRTVEIKNEN